MFLGVAVDTLKGTFHIPQQKLDDIIAKMEQLLVLRRPKVRGLASVIGKLVAAYRTFGKNLITRGSYRVISSIGYHVWNSEEAERELSWWIDNIRELNHRGRAVQPSPSLSHVDHYLAGDASGCGLYLMQSSRIRRTLISESLMPEESNTSSTLQEICVFFKFYCSPQAAQYRGQTLIHFTDNQAAASILVKGSRIRALHDMAVKVHLACQENGILLHPVCNRRSEQEMVVADRGSRGPWNGVEEFQLDFDMMADICQTQVFTIHAMATRLKNYFSKAAEVEAAGQDFFAQEWGVEEHLWVNPPLICSHT